MVLQQSRVKGCWGRPKKFRWGPFQQAFRQMRAFSIQLQIIPLSRAISKPNQVKIIMYN